MNNQPVQVPVPKPPAAHGISSNGSFGAGSLVEVPEISSAVALTIAHMSDVDMSLQQIAIRLLGGEGLAAATVFASISSYYARVIAIQKVLLAHARDDDKALTRKVTDAITPVRTIRNRFAHGIWGIPSGLPDHLLLTEASKWNSLFGAGVQLGAQAKDQETINFLSVLLIGEGGSTLSEKDHETATDLALRLSNSPQKQRAFGRLFDDGKSDSETQVWSIDLAWQAVEAAEAASFTATGLQICMDREPEEVGPLREKLLLGGLLDRPPLHFLSGSDQEER